MIGSCCPRELSPLPCQTWKFLEPKEMLFKVASNTESWPLLLLVMTEKTAMLLPKVLVTVWVSLWEPVFPRIVSTSSGPFLFWYRISRGPVWSQILYSQRRIWAFDLPASAFWVLGLQIQGTLPSLCGAGDHIGTWCTQGKHTTSLSYSPALFKVLSSDPAKWSIVLYHWNITPTAIANHISHLYV